jgi:hypothetical protein
MIHQRIWEQSEVPFDIPVYNVEVPIKGSFLTLNVRGDEHIGLNCINVDDMIEELIVCQEEAKGDIFAINTGDMIENALKKSIGHNYDIGIPDPDEQIDLAMRMQETLDRHLYGDKIYDQMKPCNRRNTKHAKRIGFIGNHEYRTRKESGVWLNKQLYSGKGVIDGGVHAIISLTIVNKQLKLKRNYKIYAAHRLTNSSGGITHSTMLKNFSKKKSDIQADIYVCGHYHRRFVGIDHRFTFDGKKKKVMYVSNPSPAHTTEYGTWGLYSPTGPGYYTNIYLPIDRHEEPWGDI